MRARNLFYRRLIKEEKQYADEERRNYIGNSVKERHNFSKHFLFLLFVFCYYIIHFRNLQYFCENHNSKNTCFPESSLSEYENI